MKQAPLDSTITINRCIKNKDGFIHLETDQIDGLTYAFYLQYKNGIEKQFYTLKPSKTFEVPFKTGFYVATFFYMYQQERKSYRVELFIDNYNNIIFGNTINETDGYSIDFFNNNSRKTFLTFNGTGSTKTSTPFGLEFLLKNNFNVVACRQNNDQYQSLKFSDIQEYVSPLLVNHDVYLYGSSLGAYCAIYYAGAVNGTVIAAAPRNSAHPLLSKILQGKTEHALQKFNHTDFSRNLKTSKKIYVFLDPHEEYDMFFINKIIKEIYPHIDINQLPFAGHEVLYHLNHTKQLSNLISAITNNNKPEILDIESCYTYFGKAKYYSRLKEYNISLAFIESALKENRVSNLIKERFKKFQQITLKKLE